MNAGRVLEQVPTHTGDCSSVGLTPDMRGCYSGGADKTVKLWQFELIDDPTGESKAKVLSILHTRTLELEEAVVAVKISPNSKFIAAALMDSTVKIFFLDTFKFYLSLYGHKLPVLCLDISYDSNIIATGSADRNVKIWGMDFGDCHKSIFAHNDSVTALQFVPSTHYFFTASKDGKVKQWDADSYDNIITLNGHAGECWGVAVGAGGLHAASCGADRALRLYARTEEPIVLGDEDEEQEGLATGETHAPVPGLPGLNMPTKKTIGAEKAADSIMECLSVGAEYKQQLAEARGQPVQVPVLMTAYNAASAEDFLLETVARIRARAECLSVGAEYKQQQLAEARGQPVQVPVLMTAYNAASAEDFLLETVARIRARDECLQLENECLQLEAEYFSLKDEYLLLGAECLPLRDECLSLRDVCLMMSAEYKQQLAEARGQPVQVPVLMTAYNAASAEDFLLETVARIRASGNDRPRGPRGRALKSALQADERVRVVSEHLTECLMLLEEAPNPEDKELVEGDVSQCLELAQDIAQAAADISRRRDGKEKPFRGKVGQGLQVPLPPVTVPVFAGDYADWPAFEDLYSSVVHTRTDITPAYKMAQLMSRLHGEPHELLTHLAVSDSNYEVAWKILTDRYRNKRLIVDRLASPPAERNGRSIRAALWGKSSDHLPTYEDLKSFLEAESRRVDVQAGEALARRPLPLATRNGRVHRREEATVGNPGGTTPHWNQGVPTAGDRPRGGSVSGVCCAAGSEETGCGTAEALVFSVPGAASGARVPFKHQL
ncbi:hypothetical protein NE865_00086 [Phthorimaea operculella]|nr:hypothetical protein NE865_00086 [Phthorimaea operculella]